MFGKNSSSAFTSNHVELTFIAEECEINGTVTIKGNARVDGQIEGNIKASGDLVIGPTAKLKAHIEAKTVSIAGEVQGDIKTTDYLELSSSARLFGDIYTKHLRIEQGALFIGSSHQLEKNESVNITGDDKQKVEDFSQASKKGNKRI